MLVRGLDRVGRDDIAAVGAKAANLGELTRVDGTGVPDGFCVTTAAFAHALGTAPGITELVEQLSLVDSDDLEAIRVRSTDVRRAIESAAMPREVAEAVGMALRRVGEQTPCAVRSSATAEDLPGASFAGQHDSYLTIVGAAAVLHHIQRCWASLYNERAVAYRQRHGFDHRTVRMAVLVQRMVDADVAGMMFTADPVTSNRRITTVEATRGLGEALVSGQVSGNVFRISDDAVTESTPAPGSRPMLTPTQVIRLVKLGRRVEAHAGRPQDIEWCLVDDDIRLVQSRDITTLFPVPVATDQETHVYVSVGHQQMMTDAMSPLGLSVWQLTAMAPMQVAGSRLFVDVTRRLASPASRAGLLEVMGRGDPLVRDALQTLLDRGDVITTTSDDDAPRPLFGGAPPIVDIDPGIIGELVTRSEKSVAALDRDLREVSGSAVFPVLLEAFQEHKRLLTDPLNIQAVMAGMDASWWLNDHLETWLGERHVADTLTLSAPGNVTSEMGLALLDVADTIRPYPEVVAWLADVARMPTLADASVLDRLAGVPGGDVARSAIETWLEVYGIRGVGEIDLARPRWCERPAMLFPLILTNIRNVSPGEGKRRVERGRRRARDKEREVLQRLRAMPDGHRTAQETQRMIGRVRSFIGYREYPKYAIIRRSFFYKRALLAEAERLVDAGVMREATDSFLLTFDELHDTVRTGRVDQDLLDARRSALRADQLLVPPRVLTSDGEALNGSYRRGDLPAEVLIGVPVSTGTVEGRARVILDMADADLAPGDILVTRFTDPSWTPLFLTAAGLVTEVGGAMTHGAVVAREYGLPAVVGVDRATDVIADGQRIRVDGNAGSVERCDAAGPP